MKKKRCHKKALLPTDLSGKKNNRVDSEKRVNRPQCATRRAMEGFL